MRNIVKTLLSDLNFVAFVLVSLFVLALAVRSALAAGRVRTVYLDERKIENILIRPGLLTALHFPVKPDNAAFGMSGVFAPSYIENDIVIGALKPQGRTNMMVYLFGRRFTFELLTSSGAYDEIVEVRDAKESPDTAKPARFRDTGKPKQPHGRRATKGPGPFTRQGDTP
jgi:hypothetical protein